MRHDLIKLLHERDALTRYAHEAGSLLVSAEVVASAGLLASAVLYSITATYMCDLYHQV